MNEKSIVASFFIGNRNFLIRMWAKFSALFKQGLSPVQIALSVVVSVIVSLLPIFGIAIIILAAIAVRFRVNLPIMIVISYIVEPLKIMLFIPFIHIGESLFGVDHTLLTFEAIKIAFESNIIETLKTLSFEFLCGICGWFLLALPISILIYGPMKSLLKPIVTSK